MESLWQDVRYAARMLIRKPGFTVLAVLSLALGIGLNSTIFSLVNAVLLRPLSVKKPDELVRLYAATTDGSTSARISYPDYADYRDNNKALDGLAAVNLTPLILSAEGQTDQILAEVVSGNYFFTLGIPIASGRAFSPEEDHAAASRVTVISHALHQRRFASGADALGKTIYLNGVDFTVIGVADESFTGTFAGASIDAWVPAMQSGTWLGRDWQTNRSKPTFQTIGRLKPGVTEEEAQAELSTVAGQIAVAYPQASKVRSIELGPAELLHGSRRATVSIFLAVVMAMVALVLMIACINVANLLLARAVARRREMAIRLAVGATRWRLIRQLLTESVLLALVGGAGGLLAAIWATDLLKAFNPIPTVPLQFDFGLDSRVLIFTISVSLATGIALGVAPAIRASKANLALSLKGESGTLTGGRRKLRLRSLLVVAQVSLSLVLLISAALFLQSLRNAQSADPGFRIENGLAMDIDLEPRGYTEEQGRRFYQNLTERIQTLPGVRSCGLANLAPLDIATPQVGIQVEGFDPPADQQMIRVSFNRIGADYFETLGIPLAAGRNLTSDDDESSPRVVVVNETMAARFWPNEQALGKQFRYGDDGLLVEVVGVAKDVKYRTLGEEPTPHFYLPLFQNYNASMTLMVSTTGEPEAMMPSVQRAVQSLDRDVQGFFARTLEEHVGFSLLPARLAASLAGGFGLLALALAVIGIYGVMTYSVSQRTREIGVRMAMGADRRNILMLILRQAVRLTLAGIATGLVAAYLLTRFLESLLFGVNATDPVTFAAISLILTGTALAACFVPARRATKVDPMVALRYE